jgi:hypothetical protein
MSIDDVLEKATIKFPRALDRNNAEKLLLYISEKLPGRINYTPKQYKSLVYDEKSNKSTLENGTLNISANLVPFKNQMEFDAFQLEPWEEDSSYVASLKFQIIPGFEFSDYQRVVPLWNNVRKIIDDYFKENLKKE